MRGLPCRQRQARPGARGQPSGRRQHPGLPAGRQQVRVRRRHPLRRGVRARRTDADRALGPGSDGAHPVAPSAARGPLPDHDPGHDVPDSDRLGHLSRPPGRRVPPGGGGASPLRQDHADRRGRRAATPAPARHAAVGGAAHHDAHDRLRPQRRRPGGDPRGERRLHLAPAPDSDSHARGLPPPLPPGGCLLPAGRRPGHRRAPDRRHRDPRRPGPYQVQGRADPRRERARGRRPTPRRRGDQVGGRRVSGGLQEDLVGAGRRPST